MAEVQAHASGSFCWCELATVDLEGAKNFYSSLFGWTWDDQEYAPGMFYTMLSLNGKVVGALYGMDDAQRERGVPPHWNVYVSVDSADESTVKAKELGGTALMEPFDVMDAGRMSIIQDPTGATFCIWQKGMHSGAAVVDEPGAFCWYELATNNANAAKSFYTGLFGWGVGGNEQYCEWKSGEQSIGGMMEIQDVPPNWLPYVMVADINTATDKAKELGGQVLMEPQAAGEYGMFSVFLDPQGACFAMFQSKRPM
jgi:predicted enzyme related to lactoylglutathione lyase